MLSLKIDVTKINKDRLFKGKNGTYLNCVVMERKAPDDYGNTHFVCESVSKEERLRGVKGAIIGNGKTIGVTSPAPKTATNAPQRDTDDVPF